jgi:hypothetical protein
MILHGTVSQKAVVSNMYKYIVHYTVSIRGIKYHQMCQLIKQICNGKSCLSISMLHLQDYWGGGGYTKPCHKKLTLIYSPVAKCKLLKNSSS